MPEVFAERDNKYTENTQLEDHKAQTQSTRKLCTIYRQGLQLRTQQADELLNLSKVRITHNTSAHAKATYDAKQGVVLKDFASGDTFDSVSRPGFQAPIEEQVDKFEMKVRVHDSKCKTRFEQISFSIPTREEIDEMRKTVERFNREDDDGADDEFRSQIEEIKYMIDNKCNCTHVDQLIRQVDESDIAMTEKSGEGERITFVIDQRIVAIEDKLDPWNNNKGSNERDQAEHHEQEDKDSDMSSNYNAQTNKYADKDAKICERRNFDDHFSNRKRVLFSRG